MTPSECHLTPAGNPGLVAGTTLALLIVVPTLAVTAFLWWNALTLTSTGLTEDHRVVAFFVVIAAILVLAVALALL
jgi:hypothetical protein